MSICVSLSLSLSLSVRVHTYAAHFHLSLARALPLSIWVVDAEADLRRTWSVQVHVRCGPRVRRRQAWLG